MGFSVCGIFPGTCTAKHKFAAKHKSGFPECMKARGYCYAHSWLLTLQ